MKKLLTLSFLFASVCGFAQKVTLALNLKQDSTYYLTTNANLTFIQDFPGQRQVVTTLINARVSHKVTAIRDSVYEMQVEYKKLGMHLEVGGKTMGFSSDDSLTSNPASKIIAAMLNKPFTIIITKSGNVLEVKNIDNLYKEMFKALPQLSDAQKAQFKNQMQQSFGEKAIKTNFQDAFTVLPCRSVGIGELWQNNSSMESIVACKTQTSYSLKDKQGTVYVIHGDAVVSANGTAEYKPISGMMMRYDHITGTGTTDLKLDKATCWVTESRVTKNIKGTVSIKDSPAIPGGLTFPMSMTGDLTVTN
jgi:hypothetical protein